MKDSKKWLDRLRLKQVRGVGIMDRREVPEGTCETCGAVNELRPYGPGGTWVCFSCAMKDKPGTARRYREIVFGDKTH